MDSGLRGSGSAGSDAPSPRCPLPPHGEERSACRRLEGSGRGPGILAWRTDETQAKFSFFPGALLLPLKKGSLVCNGELSEKHCATHGGMDPEISLVMVSSFEIQLFIKGMASQTGQAELRFMFVWIRTVIQQLVRDIVLTLEPCNPSFTFTFEHFSGSCASLGILPNLVVFSCRFD